MRRIIKIGGSLLCRPTLVADLRRYLNDQPPAHSLLIVGGGQMVDAVRELDGLRPLPSADVHWMCVDLLHATFQMCRCWLAELDAIDCRNDLSQWLERTDDARNTCPDPRTSCISPRAFYRREDDSGKLPETWATTTDSIAALLAEKTRADELVLLKSCDVDSKVDVDQMTESEIVDAAFPRAIERWISDRGRDALQVMRLPDDHG
ncbi:amino acid kinase family protein [Crateriforma conspicua]|uniref:Amino acid kinase family protein n=1 Tax=Crateriforma conspicua TaxID=2527996 RepID=A0A5C5Y4I9_9PLAN|nr:hypothetical protein [Crateriforma conspicua]TWT69643.1 Amino acid kinase family protein [Crateriforma conspicua]